MKVRLIKYLKKLDWFCYRFFPYFWSFGLVALVVYFMFFEKSTGHPIFEQILINYVPTDNLCNDYATFFFMGCFFVAGLFLLFFLVFFIEIYTSKWFYEVDKAFYENIDSKKKPK